MTPGWRVKAWPALKVRPGLNRGGWPDEQSGTGAAIRRIEAEIAALKNRWPAHSVKPSMVEQLKGVTCRQMVEAGRRVKEAGITLSVTVILGLGGVEDSERHALATAQILTEIDPDYAGALTLTLVPGTPLAAQVREGLFHPITPFQSLEELKIIVENASFTRCFFSSMHASNYFSIKGWLPAEKERMIGELAYVLEKKDPRLLRPEYARGL